MSKTDNSRKVVIPPIFLDLPTVADVVALSESTVQELVRQGLFPKPRQMSGRRVGWLIREVQEWAESRPVSNLPPPPNTDAPKPRTSRARVCPT
ncbi:MAG: AlpA family phage regulatory protein [Proteobacteria bacterium]|nr:AlpA family phage regulatory protein [Pseudomonadota bacterium]